MFGRRKQNGTTLFDLQPVTGTTLNMGGKTYREEYIYYVIGWMYTSWESIIWLKKQQFDAFLMTNLQMLEKYKRFNGYSIYQALGK